MKKLEKSTFKGINYIELKSLPPEQAEALRQSLTARTLIKIVQEESVLDDCVLYSAYEEWYESVKVKSTNNKQFVERPLSVTK